MIQDVDELEAMLVQAGAAQRSHGPGILLDHLLGVHRLLEQWEARQALRVAGLFHSVYGTKHFSAPLFFPADRSALRRTIGDDAEHLAWAYSHLERNSLLARAAASRAGNPTPSEVSDLATLMAANIVEQDWLWTTRRKQKNREFIASVAALCSPFAARSLLSERSA